MYQRRKQHPLLERHRSRSPATALSLPAWDSSNSDLSRFKEDRVKVVLRKLASISKNNALASVEVRRKVGDVQGASARCRAPSLLPHPPFRHVLSALLPLPSPSPPSPIHNSLTPTHRTQLTRSALPHAFALALLPFAVPPPPSPLPHPPKPLQCNPMGASSYPHRRRTLA
jgi:hypothetical protein